MDTIKINNIIKHKCLFCNQTVEMDWDKREHRCRCGVLYRYIPNKGKLPGKGYLERTLENK